MPAPVARFAVSDLVRVQACPVRYYYDRDKPFAESGRYAVCKQLSCHLGNPLDEELIWAEILVVSPGIDPALREFLQHCIAACAKATWRQAQETDVRVFSEKQGIAGLADRVFADGSFSIIRSSGALPSGTYAADRLRVAAVALCLEEMTGGEVAGGFVEYIPDGISRFHEVQPRDRRQLMTTLHRIRSIHNGELPPRPLNAPCARCGYREKCETAGGHRLSELL